MFEHKFNFQNSVSARITCIYCMICMICMRANFELGLWCFLWGNKAPSLRSGTKSPSWFEVTSLCTEVSSQVPSPKLLSEQSWISSLHSFCLLLKLFSRSFYPTGDQKPNVSSSWFSPTTWLDTAGYVQTKWIWEIKCQPRTTRNLEGLVIQCCTEIHRVHT